MVQLGPAGGAYHAEKSPLNGTRQSIRPESGIGARVRAWSLRLTADVLSA